jgi:proteasome lid subunit RPN8/RPN11
MAVKVTHQHLDEIRQHGERTYPEECGGLLLGVLEGETLVIKETLPLENIRQDSRHNRVVLNDMDVLRAEREAAKHGLGLWGYYHSHPDHPARPSEFDRAHAAWTDWAYLIVSVHQQQAQEVRAWRLQEDRSQFDEETILTYEQP